MTKECNRLFQVAETIIERRDVLFIQEKLKKEIKELREARKKDDDYDELEVERLKTVCDKDALRLEEVLAQFSDKLKARVDDRRYVKIVYDRMLSAIAIARNRGMMESVAELLADYAYVADIHRQAKHLDFQMLEEEREGLRLAEKAINKVER